MPESTPSPENTEKPNTNLIDRFFYWCAVQIVEFRGILFSILLLVTFGSLFFAKEIKVDNSLELWFLEDDPTLIAYREFKKLYGNDEIILALINCEKEGVFTLENLRKIWKSSKSIEDNKTNFKRVLSIGLAPYIGLQNGTELIVEDMITEEPKSPEDLEKIKKRFFDDPFKVKLLTDLARKYTVMIIEPVASHEMDQKRPILIQAVKEKLKGLDFHLAGMGVMYDELNRLSIRDGALFTTVAYSVIVIVVFFLFRSWIFTGMIIAVMILGTCSFLGLYGFFKQNFNMVTIVLPTLMLILSISDVSYIYNNYCYNIAHVMEDKKKGLIRVFSECLSPCLFTSLTNFFGFISIVSSPMEVLRGFGFFAAYATIAEYIISMISAAFILSFINPQKGMDLRRPFASSVEWCVRLMPKYYRTVMFLLLLTSIAGIYGISKIEVDTYSMGFLQDSNQVRRESDFVEKNYGYYLPLEIRLLTGKTDGIKEPDFLKRLSEAHDELEKFPEIQRAASIVDVFKKLNQVMSSEQTSSYKIPDSFEAASQLMMLYSSDPDNDLEHMTDRNFSEARLTVRVPMVSAANLYRIEKMVKEYLEKKFSGTGVKIVFGGYVPLYARLINYITQSQIQSFGWALLFIFGAMALLFRRFDPIWLGIIPNVYPILMTMGMMGLLEIRLDIATVTIASIALGVAVDDTIHELYLFYDPARKHLEPVESISECLIEAGPAVISTAIIYALGFSALALASIKSVIYFGALLAMTLVFGMLCEITIMPALICMFKDYLARSREK